MIKQQLFDQFFTAIGDLKRQVRSQLDARIIENPMALLEASDCVAGLIQEFWDENGVAMILINPSLAEEFFTVFEVRYNTYRDTFKTLMSSYRDECCKRLPEEFRDRTIEGIASELESIEAQLCADDPDYADLARRMDGMVPLRVVLERYSNLRERWITARNEAMWRLIQEQG